MTMRLSNKWIAPALAAQLALPGAALAAGFQVNEHNARATGRAGSFFATVDDASAVFYNPAGLTNVKGTQAMVGVTLLRPTNTYEGVGLLSVNTEGQTLSQSTEGGFVPVPNVYFAHALSEKAAVGIGFYAPYGLGVKWPDQWVGRTSVQEISLRTFFLTPSVALKLADNVSVGVSISLVPSTLGLRRVLGANDNLQVLFPASQYGQEGAVELSGSAFGVGANAGVQVTLIENLKLGFAYRSAVALDFTGNADFQVPTSVPASIRANFPDGPVTGAVTLPHAFSLGVGWVTKSLSVELSSTLTLWDSYQDLTINFLRNLPAPTSASPRNWTSTPAFRLGGEYMFGDVGFADLTVRAGAMYDLTPAPDSTVEPGLPDANRFVFSGGAGLKFGKFFVDLAYMGVLVGSRSAGASVNFPIGNPAGTDAGGFTGGLVHVLSTRIGVNL
jgi:long-chain fatty acid transport protein